MKRLSGIFIGLLLLILFTPCAWAARPKRVLILEPYTQKVAPFDAAISGFRSTLAQGMGERIDIHSIPLDLARFSEPAGEDSLTDFLEARIKNQPVDLVVPIGGAAAQFVARHRKRIFADTPILAVGSQLQTLPPGFLKSQRHASDPKARFYGHDRRHPADAAADHQYRCSVRLFRAGEFLGQASAAASSSLSPTG